VLVGERASQAATRAAIAAMRPRSLGQRAKDAPLWQKVAALIAVFLFNLSLFFLPIDYAALGAVAYPGAFLLTFVANAAVVVPVPYVPIIAHMSTQANVVLVVLLAALGSALGECVAFFVGRVEKQLFTGHPWFERIRYFFRYEWRAALFLFFFSIPLNPVFDAGGLGAGALGIRFPVFFIPVLLGRIIRFAIIALVASGVIGFLQPFLLAR
jgi:membrane protein YqaA with SNARE-associated domain